MRRLQEQGLSYAAVAAEFGLSEGRVGQITQNAPPAERALFGVGPVTVALPLRSVDRSLPVITSGDALAYERLVRLLDELQLAVDQPCWAWSTGTARTSLLDAVRGPELADPHGRTWPRAKRHDDQTLVVVRSA
jgi:hypothetical protein